MSDDNPQDVQTPGTTEPDEPGEIGWHANADSPNVDASIPKAGSGGAKAEDMPVMSVSTTPGDPSDERTDSQIIAAEPAPYDEWSEDDLRTEIQNRQAAGETLPDVTDASKEQMVAALNAEDASRADAVLVDVEAGEPEPTPETPAE